MTEHKINLLEHLSFWKNLTKAQQVKLEREAHFLSYKQGALVYSTSRECLGVVLLREGRMRAYLLSDEGKEVTLYRLDAGETCVLQASCVLSAITFQVEMEAETDCKFLLIPAPVFQELTRENIYVENFAYKVAAERFSNVVDALQRMLFMSLSQRIAAFLIDESAKTGEDNIYKTQEEMARIIGSAREAVSRTLKQMVKSGLVSLFRGGVKIEQKRALYELLEEYPRS